MGKKRVTNCTECHFNHVVELDQTYRTAAIFIGHEEETGHKLEIRIEEEPLTGPATDGKY